MAAAAVVAGNAVILKPSDQTPVIAARLMELLMEAGLPPGVANLVTGPGSQVGAHLAAHPLVDFIAFTGSKEVGLGIWELAGRTVPGQANLKRVICEMGGKNCVIIDSDADLDEAVVGCIASAFGYQGQKCSEWVREWRCRHSLPVVAIGSIPYIYRRVGFRLRATPTTDANPHPWLRIWTE
jgi:RHH-type proline utilization regulon transcriptional repressor/proline dehydrogenase/delta 1-pyrroline-5-carboxylate dehydrogenase